MSSRHFIAASLFACTSLLGTAAAQEPDLYDPTAFRTIELTFAQPDWWDQLRANYDSGDDIEADLVLDGVTYPTVGVHFKGNSSYELTGGSKKKSFSISLDTFVPGQEFQNYDSINLNNCFMDPTFMRETLASQSMNHYLPAPRANFVKLVINGEAWGVYSNSEQVDGRFMKRAFGNKDGNRYKATEAIPGSVAGGSALVWRGPNAADYQNNYDLKNPGNADAWTDLIALIDVLNHAPQASLAADLAPLICVDDALWLNATSAVFADPDSYVRAGEEYFLYHDSASGQFRLSQYDLNESFGASSFGGFSTSSRIRATPFMNEGSAGFPLMNRLLADPDLRQDYIAHIRTLVDEQFNTDAISARIMQHHQLIDAEVQADPKRLYSYNKYINNLTDTVSPEWWMPAAGLMEMATGRSSYLLNHAEIDFPAPTIDGFAVSPEFPSSGDPITITASVSNATATTESVRLRWRIAGSGPYLHEEMFDDGAHNDGAAGDGIWGVTLPPQTTGAQIEFILRAASDLASGGAVKFSPTNTARAPHEFVVSGPRLLRINEFMALNQNGVQDEAGQFEDWIELHNMTASPLDIGGYFLSDDDEDPYMWSVPAGTTVSANGFVLIWADNDSDGPLHANFKLSGGGDQILLHHSDGSLLDHYTFDQQQVDVSTGRLTDGEQPWVSLIDPSPASANDPACGFRRFDDLDAARTTLQLAGAGGTSLGQTADFLISNAAPSLPVSLFASASRDLNEQVLPNLPVLIDINQVLMTVTLQADANGDALYQTPLGPPATVGATFWVQAYQAQPLPAISNGLQLTICP